MTAKPNGANPPSARKTLSRVVSNEGQTGAESIRIGGMTLDTMGMAESAITQQQLPMARAANKKQEIENVKSQFPKPKISYYEGRISECEGNIKRVQNLITEQRAMIEEYTGLIAINGVREKMLADIDQNDRKAVLKINLQYPPYDVDAMRQQIVQSNEAIERSDAVIKQEYDSIIELKQAIGRCMMRNDQLRKLGADMSDYED